MSKFEIGDRVQMPGVPLVVEVLELKRCDEYGDRQCDMGDGEVFRFKDPESGEDDWMHTAEFEKVAA